MHDASSAKPAHTWSPLTDLSASDRAVDDDEAATLASVWADERQLLDDDHAVQEFNRRLKVEWAIETGILERIYSLDRGVTQLLIERGIDASLIPADATDQPPELVAAIISDHETGIDLLFDFVKHNRNLSVGFIKELHALMTRHQRTTTGIDQFGHRVDVPLRHGEFKDWPNNPTRPDGRVHQYCPPEHVAPEVERLVTLHLEHIRTGVPISVQAAWLHHRFAQIHPFADGNGRVARALASLVFISAGWFPLVVTRDDRAAYIDALEVADGNGLGDLVALFAARQKRAFVQALGIAREVTRDGQRVDQQIAAIAEMFAKRDMQARAELERAKSIARSMWARAVERFNHVAEQLAESIATTTAKRRAFSDYAEDSDAQRRSWHRWQVVNAAHDLGYYAGFSDFACWVRLCIETESGRSEVLLALHGVGPEYRGLVGGSMTFYRRQETPDGEKQLTELQTVSDEVLQINYKEDVETVGPRFERWMERGLVRALDAWRRGE